MFNIGVLNILFRCFNVISVLISIEYLILSIFFILTKFYFLENIILIIFFIVIVVITSLLGLIIILNTILVRGEDQIEINDII